MDARKTGSFIAELRKEKELTQKQLAERLLVSDKAVSRWETGHGIPDIENLEALALELDVSMAELLRGERIVEPVEPAEADMVAQSVLSLARELLSRRIFQNVAMGFLAGLIVAILAVVHLTAPIALPYREGIIRVDELADGSLVAIAESEAAGIDVSTVGGETFISVYDTRWRQISREERELVALVGTAEQTGAVLYYPGTPDDVLLYGSIADMGVMTLPRLVYNGWLTIGLAASIVGLIAFAILRKRWYAKRILRVALIPVCFTASLAAVLWGHFGEVYNAAFYLSGICLVALALYGLALFVLARRPAE